MANSYKIKAEVDGVDGAVDYWVMARFCFFFWVHIHPYSRKIDAEEVIKKLNYGNS